MSAAENRTPARQAAKEPQAQSAAAPSPFPPIADYAFLSNCHTGALVAPMGRSTGSACPAFDGDYVVHRKCRGVAILADCRVGAFFGFDYALIAAMSG
jgi:hypothetical protein